MALYLLHLKKRFCVLFKFKKGNTLSLEVSHFTQKYYVPSFVIFGYELLQSSKYNQRGEDKWTNRWDLSFDFNAHIRFSP